MTVIICNYVPCILVDSLIFEAGCVFVSKNIFVRFVQLES